MLRYVVIVLVLLVVSLLWWREAAGPPGPVRAAECPFDLATPHKPGDLLIRFVDDAPPDGWQQLFQTSGEVFFFAFQSGGFLVRIPGASDQDLRHRASELLERHPGRVDYIQANILLRAQSACAGGPATGDKPNDPCLSDQGQEWLRAVGAPTAWDQGKTGSSAVKVAIVDDGVECDHPDLSCDTNRARDFHDVYPNQQPKPGADPAAGDHHGTRIAGIIGAIADNGVGIAGVNWHVSLVPLRAGAFKDIETAAAAQAIEYAASEGVGVVNLSFESHSKCCGLQEAIAFAADKDVLVVASAGNAGADNDSIPVFPASFPEDNIVAVASTDTEGNLASDSNFGVCSVDLGAPGAPGSNVVVGLLSTNQSHGYDYSAGTSYATAVVSGGAALLRAAYPGEGYEQIKARLLGAAQRNPMSIASATRSGGWLDLAAAMANSAPTFVDASGCSPP